MIYWSIYICFAIFLSHLFGLIAKQNYLTVFFFFLIIFITPAQIDLDKTSIAPAIFTFLFNLTLEQDLSLRAIRPLMITMPVYFALVVITKFIRKKFFHLKDL